MDDGLKQRLIGALVLIAIAVIFLPSLFSGEHGRRLDTRTQIPPAPETKVLVIAQPKPVEGIPKAPAPEAMYQLLEEDVAVESSGVASTKKEPAVVKKAADTVKPKVADVSAEESKKPGLDERNIPRAWAIQVASYNTEARANKLLEQLKADDYKAFLHPVVIGKGKVYRVLVGPKIDRTNALQVKVELDKLLKVSSILVKFQP